MEVLFMLAISETTLVIRELCRLMEEYYEAPKSAKTAIHDDIVLLGKVIEPDPMKVV